MGSTPNLGWVSAIESRRGEEQAIFTIRLVAALEVITQIEEKRMQLDHCAWENPEDSKPVRIPAVEEMSIDISTDGPAFNVPTATFSPISANSQGQDIPCAVYAYANRNIASSIIRSPRSSALDSMFDDPRVAWNAETSATSTVSLSDGESSCFPAALSRRQSHSCLACAIHSRAFHRYRSAPHAFEPSPEVGNGCASHTTCDTREPRGSVFSPYTSDGYTCTISERLGEFDKTGPLATVGVQAKELFYASQDLETKLE